MCRPSPTRSITRWRPRLVAASRDGIPFEIRWGSQATSSKMLKCRPRASSRSTRAARTRAVRRDSAPPSGAARCAAGGGAVGCAPTVPSAVPSPSPPPAPPALPAGRALMIASRASRTSTAAPTPTAGRGCRGASRCAANQRRLFDGAGRSALTVSALRRRTFERSSARCAGMTISPPSAQPAAPRGAVLREQDFEPAPPAQQRAEPRHSRWRRAELRLRFDDECARRGGRRSRHRGCTGARQSPMASCPA